MKSLTNSEFKVNANSTAVQEPEVMKSIDIKRFPEEIANQVKILTDLQNKVDNAKQQAEDAKKGSDTLQGYVDVTFLGIKRKKGDTPAIIEGTQEVVKTIGAATEANSKALDLVYQYQEASQKAIEYLFGLGCVNVSATEAMIDDILAIRDGRTNFGGLKLTDEIKERILSVADRLRQQQEIRRRQENIENKFVDFTRDTTNHLTEIKEQFTQNIHGVQETSENIAKELDEAKSKFAEGVKDAKESSENVAKDLDEAKNHFCEDLKSAKEAIAKVAEELNMTRETVQYSIQLFNNRIMIAYVIGGLGAICSMVTLILSILDVI